MKTNQKIFLLTNNLTNSVEFYSNNGGYPWWSTDIKDAKFFNNQAEIKELLNTNDFEKEQIMVSGVKYPPRMLHSALKINNTSKKGSGILSIVELILVVNENIRISGEIKDVKGFKY